MGGRDGANTGGGDGANTGGGDGANTEGGDGANTEGGAAIIVWYGTGANAGEGWDCIVYDVGGITVDIVLQQRWGHVGTHEV